MALYGYARVSTLDQNLGIQRAALKVAGCDVIRAEKASGTRRDGRTELQVLLDFLRPGDALVVITDGLPEMMDATGAFYTMERVAIDIASLSNHTPVQIVTELAARVMDFAAGTSQADDVTALAVRIGHRSA